MLKKNCSRLEANHVEEVIRAAESPTSTSGSSNEIPHTTRMRATGFDRLERRQEAENCHVTSTQMLCGA
jgi:hypothetical protein